MTWYPDMGTATMMASGEYVRAVGWLSAAHPFPVGDTPKAFQARLTEFCGQWHDGLEPLAWGVFRGSHECELCHGWRMFGNIGVPAGDVLFIAPEMVHHYVADHRYAPPGEFVAAVLRSPLPRANEYRAIVEPFRRQLEETCKREDEAWQPPCERERELRRLLEQKKREIQQQRELEPLRKLEERKSIDEAARWAFGMGGREGAVSDAAHRFFGHRSPELCERIRQAMPRT